MPSGVSLSKVDMVEMTKEIGSEYWDIPLSPIEKNNLFPDNAGWFLSGRAALSFVIGDIQARRPFHSVAMPSWCCHTMIEPFVQHGISVRFYPVYPDADGRLAQDMSVWADCDALLVMDYFGCSRQENITGFPGIIIRDATHSLFAGVPDDADYVFGSLRKWAGFWTGGYAWRRNGGFASLPPEETDVRYIALRRRAMEEKRQYISGERADKGYLSIFGQAEDLLDRAAHKGAAERDVDAALKLDTEYLRARRRENAAFLLEKLGHMALFPKLREEDCPLFVPILVPDGKRDALRRHLIEREIYCPVHWPVSDLHQLNSQTRRVYDEGLSLVCDQRYTVGDMERLCAAVLDFFA